ncbi:hypothetical protein ACLOJK_040140 [Asimina triloba]
MSWYFVFVRLQHFIKLPACNGSVSSGVVSFGNYRPRKAPGSFLRSDSYRPCNRTEKVLRYDSPSAPPRPFSSPVHFQLLAGQATAEALVRAKLLSASLSADTHIQTIVQCVVTIQTDCKVHFRVPLWALGRNDFVPDPRSIFSQCRAELVEQESGRNRAWREFLLETLLQLLSLLLNIPPPIPLNYHPQSKSSRFYSPDSERFYNPADAPFRSPSPIEDFVSIMAASSLPPPVQELLSRICRERGLDLPEPDILNMLIARGEGPSLDILQKISAWPQRIRSLSGFIVHMAKKECSSGMDISSPSSQNCCSGPGPRSCNTLFVDVGSSSQSCKKAGTEMTSPLLDAFGELEFKKNLERNSEKAHVYHCHVALDGSFTFKV